MAIEQLATPTGNFYLDVIYHLHNQLWKLTQLGGPRDTALSAEADGAVVKNIELAPVVMDRVRANAAPSLHISVDSSETANDLEKIVGEFVELLNIRIEVYLNTLNTNTALTVLTGHILDDMRQVLSPNAFVNSELSAGARISNAGILQWGFDERTRGTADEILVYIVQVQLHHFIARG